MLPLRGRYEMMKHTSLVLLTVAALTVAFTASAKDAATPAAAKPGASAADTLWQKIDDAMNELKQPKERPKSQEEMMEKLKKALTEIDANSKEFLDKNPTDPRRWKLRMFDGMTEQARAGLGLPPKVEMKTALAEILKSTDADAETKGEASAISVLEASRDIDAGKMKSDEWQKLAEAHLKSHPGTQFNKMIEDRIKSAKALADLQSKPLDLKFTATNGHEVDLAGLRGKVVLVDFWATWCGPCVGEVPNVVKTYEKLHGKGFEIVGISLDEDKAKLEAFTKEKNMTWPQYFDGKGWENEIATRFGIHSIPAMWLVNKKGIVTSTEAREGLEATVEKLLAE